MDIISILKKKRVDLHDYAVEISAVNADEHPKVYTKINIHFKFYGNNIHEKDVERAIELSETKYCSVSAMLKKTAEIITTFEILEPEKRY
jgi:putative redox protein